MNTKNYLFMLKIQQIKKVVRNLIPINELDILLSESIKKRKEFLHTHPEYRLKLPELLKLVYFIFQYKQGYSVAAITKHKEFFGIEFFVNKHVLIPRPETELIIEETLNEINNSAKKILLIDVGTGSGCIPISILKNTKNIHSAIALDISKDALKVAEKNIIKYKTDTKLLKSNLLTKILDQDYQTFDQIIITANLPYLTNTQVKEEPSIHREPKIALIAKENGLALYHQLLIQITKIFNNKKLLVLFEIDPTQTDQITQLTQEYLPKSKIEIKKDLANLDRILKIST